MTTGRRFLPREVRTLKECDIFTIGFILPGPAHSHLDDPYSPLAPKRLPVGAQAVGWKPGDAAANDPTAVAASGEPTTTAAGHLHAATSAGLLPRTSQCSGGDGGARARHDSGGGDDRGAEDGRAVPYGSRDDDDDDDALAEGDDGGCDDGCGGDLGGRGRARRRGGSFDGFAGRMGRHPLDGCLGASGGEDRDDVDTSGGDAFGAGCMAARRDTAAADDDEGDDDDEDARAGARHRHPRNDDGTAALPRDGGVGRPDGLLAALLCVGELHCDCVLPADVIDGLSEDDGSSGAPRLGLGRRGIGPSDVLGWGVGDDWGCGVDDAAGFGDVYCQQSGCSGASSSEGEVPSNSGCLRDDRDSGGNGGDAPLSFDMAMAYASRLSGGGSGNKRGGSRRRTTRRASDERAFDTMMALMGLEVRIRGGALTLLMLRRTALPTRLTPSVVAGLPRGGGGGRARVAERIKRNRVHSTPFLLFGGVVREEHNARGSQHTTLS